MKKPSYYEALKQEKCEIAFSLLRESIKNGEISNYKVVSDSMSPLLRAGDEISIKNIAFSKLKIGDIIAYKINDEIYVHRLIYRLQKNGNSPRLVTKGDNMLGPDQWLVSPQDLLGKVTSVRYGGAAMALESIFWRVSNYFSALISSSQAGAIIIFKRIKRFFWNNKKTPFAVLLKKSLLLPLYFLSRALLFINTFFNKRKDLI